MENWRDIPGYEGIYQVSNMGNVRSCEGKTTQTLLHGTRCWKQRTLKQKFSQNKYGRSDARVHLWKSGIAKTLLVSRLVGLAWCDGFSEGMTINHINGNSLDNRAENLEWVTLEENIKKGRETGLYASAESPIVLRFQNQDFSFHTTAEGSRFLGRNHSYIFNCIKNNRPIRDADGNEYCLTFRFGLE